MVNVIFLYYRETGYNKEVLDTLQIGDIHFTAIETNREAIETNRGIISNLIPNTLIRGAKSWLIFSPPIINASY